MITTTMHALLNCAILVALAKAQSCPQGQYWEECGNWEEVGEALSSFRRLGEPKVKTIEQESAMSFLREDGSTIAAKIKTSQPRNADRGQRRRLCDSCRGCGSCPAHQYHRLLGPPSSGHYYTRDSACLCVNCNACGPGRKLSGCGANGNGGTCPECEAGKYQDSYSHRLTTCKSCGNCNAGKYLYCSKYSGPVCFSCPRGQYKAGTNGGTSCSACNAAPAGKYFSIPGQVSSSCTSTFCPACAAGKYLRYCGGTNPGSCPSCPANQYVQANGHRQTTCSDCNKCGSGKYISGCGTSVGSCKNCPAGKFKLSTVNDYNQCSFCSSCEKGKYLKGCDGGGFVSGVCTACDAGKYIDQSSHRDRTCKTCRLCPSGKHQTGCSSPGAQNSGGCASCPIGTYKSGSSTSTECTSCRSCPPGHYRSGCTGGSSTNANCFLCQAGKYQPSTSTSNTCMNCKTCGKEYFLENCGEGSTESGSCTRCPLGRFKNTVDQRTSCDQCADPDIGTYFVYSDTKQCQTALCTNDQVIGTYYTSHGGTENKCVTSTCPSSSVGKYFVAPFAIDQGTSSASYCNTNNCADCNIGYWRQGCESTNQGSCVQCTGRTPGHRFISSGGIQDQCQEERCACPIGQYAFQCGADAHGTSQGQCTSCNAHPEGHYHVGDGDAEGNCKHQQCGTDCPTGEYRFGCNGVSEGLCMKCSIKPADSYFTGDGNLTDSCPWKACGACEIGYYRKGCEGSNPGTCVPCTGLQPNHYFSGSGYTRDQCRQSACTLDCGIGKYKAECNFNNPGTCLECVANKSNMYFTSQGRVANDPNSCDADPCTTCATGYHKYGCTGANAGKCETCTNPMERPFQYYTSDGGFANQCKFDDCVECNAGYELKMCNSFYRGQCELCPVLPFGQYYTKTEKRNTCIINNCSADCGVGMFRDGCEFISNGSCVACTNNEPNTYMVSSGGLEDNCEKEACNPAQCAIGEYLGNCGGIASGTCQLCKPSRENTYFSSIGTFSEDSCVEENCDICQNGYERVNCTGNNPGVCVPCSIPQAGYYHDDADNGCFERTCPTFEDYPIGFRPVGCGGLSKGECVPCGNNYTGSYFISDHTKECEIARCETCAAGTKRVGCSGDNAGECVSCDTLPVGHYYTTNGTDSCSKTQCDFERCKVGQYLIDCGVDDVQADAGRCTPCVRTLPNSYFTTNGKISDSCNEVVCASCPTGQFRVGCVGAEPGKCIGCGVTHVLARNGSLWDENGLKQLNGTATYSNISIQDCEQICTETDCVKIVYLKNNSDTENVQCTIQTALTHFVDGASDCVLTVEKAPEVTQAPQKESPTTMYGIIAGAAGVLMIMIAVTVAVVKAKTKAKKEAYKIDGLGKSASIKSPQVVPEDILEEQGIIPTNVDITDNTTMLRVIAEQTGLPIQTVDSQGNVLDNYETAMGSLDESLESEKMDQEMVVNI